MWTVCVTLICIEKKHKPQNVDSLCKVISRTFTKVRNCLRKIEKWYKNSNNCGAFCSLRGFKRGSFAFVFCLVFLLGGGGGMGFFIVKIFYFAWLYASFKNRLSIMIFIAWFFFWTKGNNRGLRPPCVLFMQNHCHLWIACQ